MEKNSKKSKFIVASVAGLLAASSFVATASVAHAEDAACYGINACKGTGDCGGKGYSCHGKNECKGTGFINLDKEVCTRIQGGRLTA